MGIKCTKLFERSDTYGLKNNSVIPKEDLELLRIIGIDIKELIGFGEYGTVYQGIYNSTAIGIRDNKDQLLNVSIGQKFAVKYINIKEREENELMNEMSDKNIRRFTEKHKLIQQKLFHSNLVKNKICVNLGDCQPICINDKRNTPLPLEDISIRLSYDRIYLFMDFADFGNLDNYLHKLNAKGLTISESDAKNWCKQLLSALEYLHESNVFHENIKPNNVLLFNENQSIVAKLSDFGLQSYYYKVLLNDSENEDLDEENSNSKGLDLNLSPKILDQMSDIHLLANIFELIIKNTKFDSDLNQNSVQDLVKAMQEFSYKQCIDIQTHHWFET